MTEKKLDKENTINRTIEVSKKGNSFIIDDRFNNTIEKDAEGLVMYFTQVFQNNAALLKRIQELYNEIKRYWIDVDQNEELMDKLRPMVSKARVELIKEQKIKERGGKTPAGVN